MQSVKFIWILLLTISYGATCQGTTWKDALIKGEAELEVLWCHCDVFFKQEKEKYMGAEYEILEEFTKYSKQKFGVNVTLVPNGDYDVKGILEVMKGATKPNLLGTSLFSINPERAEFYELSHPYLPEFTVLVTHKDRQLARKEEELQTMLKRMTLLTLNGTSLEGYARQLENDMDFKFPSKNARTTTEMLELIEKDDQYFCIVDLPVYLDWVSKGHPVIRQNFYTYPGSGFGFLLSKGSDWVNPINHFITDPANVDLFKRITKKYLGEGFYEFVNELPTDEKLGTSLLTKEKEIQQMLIENANLRIENNNLIQKSLLIGLEISVAFLAIIGLLFYKNRKNLGHIVKQKELIEEQQESIEKKNDMLQYRNLQLVEMNEERKNFLSIMAHDLRSPLNNIMTCAGLPAEVLAAEKDLNPMEMIYTEAERMRMLIEKLLNEDAIEGRENLVKKESVDVTSVAKDIVRHYSPIGDKKSIHLAYIEKVKNPIIESDQLILHMILDNLVSNAIKYSASKSTTTLKVQDHKRGLQFVVKDEGPGFTKEDQQKMFGRFQKLSAKPTGGEVSTGLGLSIVKKYVHDLGGEIALKTEANRGSEFTIFIPYN